MTGRQVLMNPGPVVLEDSVRQAQVLPDLCHREPEFAELLLRVRSRVTTVCGGDDEGHTCVVLTGSGTSAVEAAIASAVPARGSLLVLDNGHYGQRMYDIARVHQIATHRLEHGWGSWLDLDGLDHALGAGRFSTVGVVHHETSTGMLNDVAAVVAIAARHGAEVIVDAVSSVGAEPLTVASSGTVWLAGSAGKCLEAPPGLAFVCARREAFAALAGGVSRSYYLDLLRHYTAQVMAGAPAFTPAVPALRAFDRALELALSEGTLGRGARLARLTRQLRDGLEALGLPLLLEPQHRSVVLTAVGLPASFSYQRLHDLLAQAGFVIYAAQEELAGTHFRLSTLGATSGADIDRFLHCLAGILAAEGHPAAAARPVLAGPEPA